MTHLLSACSVTPAKNCEVSTNSKQRNRWKKVSGKRQNNVTKNPIFFQDDRKGRIILLVGSASASSVSFVLQNGEHSRIKAGSSYKTHVKRAKLEVKPGEEETKHHKLKQQHFQSTRCAYSTMFIHIDERSQFYFLKVKD